MIYHFMHKGNTMKKTLRKSKYKVEEEYTEYDEKGDCYDGATITRYEMKQPKPVYRKRVWRTGRNR